MVHQLQNKEWVLDSDSGGRGWRGQRLLPKQEPAVTTPAAPPERRAPAAHPEVAAGVWTWLRTQEAGSVGGRGEWPL